MDTWDFYYEALHPLAEKGLIEIAGIPGHCQHNAHMFWIKVRDLAARNKLLDFLKNNGVYAVFHYVPLHSSEAGLKFGRFNGEDNYTTKESERLVRLPMYYGITQEDKQKVVDVVNKFLSMEA